MPPSIIIIMIHHHHHHPPPQRDDHQRCVPRSSDRLYLRIGLLVGYAQLVRIGIFLFCFFPTRFLVLLELLMISLYKRQSLMIFLHIFTKFCWGINCQSSHFKTLRPKYPTSPLCHVSYGIRQFPLSLDLYSCAVKNASLRYFLHFDRAIQ